MKLLVKETRRKNDKRKKDLARAVERNFSTAFSAINRKGWIFDVKVEVVVGTGGTQCVGVVFGL